MRPSDIRIQDLPINDSLRRKLELADEFSVEELELMKNHRDLIYQLRKKEQEIVEPLEPEEYPPKLEDMFDPSKNSTRRRRYRPDPLDPTPEDELAKTELDLDQKANLDPLSIGRRQKAKNRETEKFLLDEYGGQCQICDITFEQRNGSPYFAIAHLVHRSQAKWLDNPRNALCLCANHWAQFKYGELKTLDEDILDQITDSEEDQPHIITVMLCNEPQVITFSVNHISKLRTLVEVTENL